MKIEGTNYLPPVTPVATPAAGKTQTTTTGTKEAAYDSVQLGNNQDKNVTYTPPKKLTSDQVTAIRESMAESQRSLLEAMAGNTTNQANSWLTSIGGQATTPGTSTDLSRYGLPAMATTKEGALAAISEGGAYSVDAVATRIIDMAKSMAGDDPKMLAKMKDAVKKGFEAAGFDFEKSTGNKLPDISGQTYDEVMKRFEALETAMAEKKAK